jgi:UDP-N-acetylmuramate dehydrogenase
LRTKTVNFAQYSSIKIGATKEVTLIDEIGAYPNLHLIGSASNTLVTEQASNLALLSKAFDYIGVEDNRLIIGGATPSGKIHSFCKKHNIGNLEYLSKLPGTLGGLVKMNAGMKEYEIFNHLLTVTTEQGELTKEQIHYGYRTTDIEGIIYEATFEINAPFDHTKVELFTQMRANQPKEPSLGSIFKNPVGDYAGRVIESLGLKGHRVGNIGWSEQHANFLVNYGEGSLDDTLHLITTTQQRAKDELGIELELEIIIL